MAFPLGITDCTENIVIPDAGGMYGVPRYRRAVLGRFLWLHLSDAQHPMNAFARAAWIAALKADSGRAIRNYAEARGEHGVDAEQVMKALSGDRETSGGGAN